jgi:hypothetical protein
MLLNKSTTNLGKLYCYFKGICQSPSLALCVIWHVDVGNLEHVRFSDRKGEILSKGISLFMRMKLVVLVSSSGLHLALHQKQIGVALMIRHLSLKLGNRHIPQIALTEPGYMWHYQYGTTLTLTSRTYSPRVNLCYLCFESRDFHSPKEACINVIWRVDSRSHGIERRIDQN